jgi:hypothetical protein
MTATYTIKAHEIEDFLRLFKTDYANRDITVTVETAETSPQEATNRRILQTAAAENSGTPPYKTMSIEELEAMAQ